MANSNNSDKKQKNRFGDRKDAWLVRNLDGMHTILPYIYPKKCDNEAFIQEQIDIEPALEYLKKKNETNEHPELPYKIFHIIVAALVKTMQLRPKMNRFYRGKRLWQRKEISTAFMVKKQLTDSSPEAMAFITYPEDSTIDYVHEQIRKIVLPMKSGKNDDCTNKMDILTKVPHFLLSIIFKVVEWLDYHGRVPASLMKDDPSYSTLFITNLGSIKLNAGYHHLSERGSNSIFVIIGEIHKAPVYDKEGNSRITTVLNIGITLDERIADGYYYSKTIKLFKYLMANPRLLELPANQEVDYE